MPVAQSAQKRDFPLAPKAFRPGLSELFPPGTDRHAARSWRKRRTPSRLSTRSRSRPSPASRLSGPPGQSDPEGGSASGAVLRNHGPCV